MLRNFTLILVASTAVGACTLAPQYERPVLPVAQTWSTPAPEAATTVSAADLDWRQVLVDPRLQGVVDLALQQNRDLRVAVLNIEKARAQYGVQRSALFPGVSGAVSEQRGRTPASTSPTGQPFETDVFNATIGFTAYELDLFGRVRSLKDAALQSYLATEQTSRSVRVSLIAEIANAWLTLAADQERLALAKTTLATREDSLRLVRQRVDGGAGSLLDLRNAETLAETARADVAVYTAQVAQDRNALTLLAGGDLPVDLLPPGRLDADSVLADLPAGLPSDVLARRPDVLAAERQLQAANANIGAARAAFFPRISLTGSAGSASTDLDGLFKSGTSIWSFTPQISLPIFAGGANVANLNISKADRDIAVATYEKTVQTAFREVSDALSVRATVADRLTAQERLTAAAADSTRLSQQRRDAGLDSALTLLDAQRSLYTAQQGLISARLAQATNLVTLYKTLGGGAPAT
ncbi:efflux transporter outer membrane subunit [Caulobacter vibrioides]|uniref:Efflux system protein n=2 Tax=Caulobacter vibrioides TaxID=155892 RepID=Q9AA05_CAUVC|nr:efflux transporter outer membrane subunit [Caulobacter vibrioides]YP_002516222.1 outer membrane efflux protein [Caulobacter vibrioides NA1000]AAK22791.1 efflux system protein [Caulobacter vibrioides CB15]ACL94314.1 outer membrane efflux protein [Caulobacter vibrioides NA1000]ATC27648.1 transporter [Caulobacter vibrioides]QXZ52887.1 efflux transporter outer membrane subunit [Caulobacter vibrioides]